MPMRTVELDRFTAERLTEPAELFDVLNTILEERLIAAWEIEGDAVRVYLDESNRLDVALLAESLTRKPESKLTNAERRPSILKKGKANA